MSRLIKIADWSGERRANVIFVHGLGGHPYNTWQSSGLDSFWPLWLAEDIKGLAVYTLGYSSPPTNWLGTAMPILDEAANALRVLVNREELAKGDIVFVCHSLGGLIVKQILRSSNEYRHSDPALASLVDRTKLIVFIATPHTGSGKATLMEKLGFIAWGTDSVRDLVANKSELRDLNFGYREFARNRGSSLRHLVFYEMAATLAGWIVRPDSADPGLDCKPIPIHEDHVAIAKPSRRDDLVYTDTKQCISSRFPEPDTLSELNRYPLDPFTIQWSWSNVAPRLLRLTAICLLVAALWQGVPAVGMALNTIFSIQRTVDRSDTRLVELQKQVADLTQKIVEQKISAASRPITDEARQRAAESLVPAITTLALGTDEQAQQAYSALERGDTSQAEALFESILNQKAREGAAANREAANAARNLAAFKRLTNVVEAQKLYARAAALDPTNFQTWIDLGDMAVATGKLGEAQKAYATAFAIANRQSQLDAANVNLQRNKAYSLNRQGMILERLGNLAEALTTYQRALSIYQTVDAVKPFDANWLLERATVYRNIGSVLQNQGNLAAALEAYQKGLETEKDLSTFGPVPLQRVRSAIYGRIGDVLVAQGNLADALKFYQDGLLSAKELADREPNNTDFQGRLARAYGNIGEVLASQGKLSEALESQRAALAIDERLAKADPGNTMLQNDLSVDYQNVGDVLESLGKWAEAEKSFRGQLAIIEQVATIDSKHTGRQRNLAIAYQRVGGSLAIQGKLPESLETYRKGLAIVAELANADGGNTDLQLDLAMFDGNVGRVLEAQGDLKGALASYQDELAIKDRLTKLDPSNRQWQQHLMRSFSNIGHIQEAQSEPSKAKESYQNALAIANHLVAVDPSNADWLRALVNSQSDLADVLKAENPTVAFKYLNDNVAIMERLTSLDARNANWQWGLSESLKQLALAYVKTNDLERAMDAFQKGREIILRLTLQSPDNRAWKAELERFDRAIALTEDLMRQGANQLSSKSGR